MELTFLKHTYTQVEIKALFGLCYNRGIDGQNLHAAEVNCTSFSLTSSSSPPLPPTLISGLDPKLFGNGRSGYICNSVTDPDVHPASRIRIFPSGSKKLF
jgi:hypothetical protein